MVAIISISISTTLYMINSISCFVGKDYSHALMWAGYSFANVGLLWYEFNKLGS
jgi:hypothetical protein